MLKFTSDQTDRLDKFLAHETQVSRGKVQTAIKHGLVSVNGMEILEPDYMVIVGDTIELPEFESDNLKPSDLKLKIVFENEEVVVIDKPAGLVVHPGAGNTEDTLANALISLYPGIEKVGQPHRPGIVHRLDEDTSGLILVAKNPGSYDYFKQLFMDRKVEKEYLALVHGTPSKKHDVIDLPLEKQPLKQKMSVRDGSLPAGQAGASGGKVKPALTEYWVLDASGQFSLLRVKLHTGRTHQIRAHLAHIGYPIVGDQVYGLKQDSTILTRQFLHAYKLKFQLMDGTWLELFSALPLDLKNILNQVQISYDDSNI